MVADALVYHPALAHWLRFVATTGTYPRLLYPSQTFSDDGTTIISTCIKSETPYVPHGGSSTEPRTFSANT
jgi:hypothetical protein